jgi:hypothetical protein
MNRSLKFRVWDKLEQRFILPDVGYQGHYTLSLNGRFNNLQNGSGGDEHVVQQFTGLRDKNKKEIYEGDIFESSNPSYKWGPVEFGEGRFYCNLKGARIFTLEELCEDFEYQVPEIVGNIFENPELLKP